MLMFILILMEILFFYYHIVIIKLFWVGLCMTTISPNQPSSIFLVWKEGLHDQGPVNATASLQTPLCNLLSYRILISSATGIDTAVVLAYHTKYMYQVLKNWSRLFSYNRTEMH